MHWETTVHNDCHRKLNRRYKVDNGNPCCWLPVDNYLLLYKIIMWYTMEVQKCYWILISWTVLEEDYDNDELQRMFWIDDDNIWCENCISWAWRRYWLISWWFAGETKFTKRAKKQIDDTVEKINAHYWTSFKATYEEYTCLY